MWTLSIIEFYSDIIIYHLDPSELDNSSIESEILTQVKKPKIEAKIFDGKYYTIDRVDGKTIYARCNTCNEIKKGAECSTGNFMKHYKLKHPAQLQALKTYTKSKNSVNTSAASTFTQPTLNEMARILKSDEVYDELILS